MTKISQYPTLSNPTDEDILIGTDVNSSDETKNFSIGSIVNLANETIKPYKVYTALLTQSGINSPTANVVFENTTGIVPTFNYLSTGVYNISFNEENTNNYWFTITKTDNDQMFLQKNPTNISIITTSLTGVPGDGALFNTPIEVRIYN